MEITPGQEPEPLEPRLASGRFYNEVLELVDPNASLRHDLNASLDGRIISSAANSPEDSDSKGVYVHSDWGNDLVSKLTGTYRAVFLLEGKRKADGFFEAVYDFCSQLPRLQDVDKVRAKGITEEAQRQGTEFSYHYGFAGKRYLRDRLESYGFFEKLDKVYATLFILAEITVLEGNGGLVAPVAQALKQGDLAAVKSRLEDRIRIGTECPSYAGRTEDMRHYQALRNHLEKAYETAHKLLGDLEPSKVRQTASKYHIFRFDMESPGKPA